MGIKRQILSLRARDGEAISMIWTNPGKDLQARTKGDRHVAPQLLEGIYTTKFSIIAIL
jgi:hypothetical protein